MNRSWSRMLGSEPSPVEIYLGHPGLSGVAAPHALKLAAIIAGAPQIPLEQIEENLFLHSLGGFRSVVSEEDIN